MTLEEQVVSLELAKKLKELGVKQNSLYRWADPKHIRPMPWLIDEHAAVDTGMADYYPAYTVAELGELLPNIIKKRVEDNDSDTLEDWHLSYEPDQIGHTIRYTYYYYEPMDAITISGDTEANTRAKMLIYLIENYLIKL